MTAPGEMERLKLVNRCLSFSGLAQIVEMSVPLFMSSANRLSSLKALTGSISKPLLSPAEDEIAVCPEGERQPLTLAGLGVGGTCGVVMV